MKTIIFLILIIAQTSFAAIECPKKISVTASGFPSINPENGKLVDTIFDKGEGQTSSDYIKAVLVAGSKLTTIKEILTVSKKYSSSTTCVYTGKTANLNVTYSYPKYEAALMVAKVKYEGGDSGLNPSSANGFSLDVLTKLTQFGETGVTALKASTLSMDLYIQIPLGDYGTDGYTNTYELGKVQTVKYEVVK